MVRGEALVPAANRLVRCVSYDVTPKLRLGSMVANRHPDGLTRNTLEGFDAPQWGVENWSANCLPSVVTNVAP
jgi:hypothetical protein